jgi:single-strand DNA-binding protein
MNIVAMTGRLTHTPELRQIPSGKSVCTFSLAVDRPRVKDVTDFFTFVAWDKIAEYIARYGQKGDTVEVSGVLTSRSFEDKNGAKRTAIEIKVEAAHLIKSKLQQSAEVVTEQPNVTMLPEDAQWTDTGTEDDLPF